MLPSELAIDVVCIMTSFTFSLTLQPHLNKLVRVILETHPSPTLDAQERLFAVGRQTKEPDLNPFKL